MGGDHTGIPIMLSQADMLMYEIYCHPDDAPKVWDAVVWDVKEI